jgi:hypothetical protein
VSDEKFLENRFEALLCVGWPWLFLAGYLVAAFVGPFGFSLILLSVVDVVSLLGIVQRRLHLPKGRRKVLRLWLTTNGQYQGWKTLLGWTSPPTH